MNNDRHGRIVIIFGGGHHCVTTVINKCLFIALSFEGWQKSNSNVALRVYLRKLIVCIAGPDRLITDMRFYFICWSSCTALLLSIFHSIFFFLLTFCDMECLGCEVWKKIVAFFLVFHKSGKPKMHSQQSKNKQKKTVSLINDHPKPTAHCSSIISIRCRGSIFFIIALIIQMIMII